MFFMTVCAGGALTRNSTPAAPTPVTYIRKCGKINGKFWSAPISWSKSHEKIYQKMCMKNSKLEIDSMSHLPVWYSKFQRRFLRNVWRLYSFSIKFWFCYSKWSSSLMQYSRSEIRETLFSVFCSIFIIHSIFPSIYVTINES